MSLRTILLSGKTAGTTILLRSLSVASPAPSSKKRWGSLVPSQKAKGLILIHLSHEVFEISRRIRVRIPRKGDSSVLPSKTGPAGFSVLPPGSRRPGPQPFPSIADLVPSLLQFAGIGRELCLQRTPNICRSSRRQYGLPCQDGAARRTAGRTHRRMN